MNDYGYMLEQTMHFLSMGMGCLSERQMEHLGPLPKELQVANREMQRLSCLETMEQTARSLKQLLKAGMEENRFGVPYVQISKMILDAVTTMGRGLVTLRVLGEDPALAPMQIGDLLDIASFHFQKCAQGVAHSAGVNMTVCTRLFASQLRWQNLIFRLYRTEEFLGKPHHAEKKTKKAAQSLPAPESVTAESGSGALRPEQTLKPFPTEAATETTGDLSGENTVNKEENIPDLANAEIRPETPAVQDHAEDTGEEPEATEVRHCDPIRECFSDWEWDGVPYVSDALVQRKLAEIRALREAEKAALQTAEGPPEYREPIPIPLFEEAEVF